MTTPVNSVRWTIRRYDTVTSTMDVAAQLIADGEESGPTVVVADDQTAGRGRANRSWRSIPGGSLQMTAILSLPVSLSGLGPVPLLVGNIVAESIEALDDCLKPTLKWPNDVLIHGRKVAGILIVSRSTGESTLLQIGIGVNFADPESSGGSSIGLGRIWEMGYEEPLLIQARDRLLGEILSRLVCLSDELIADGGVAGLERWVRRATLLGEPVCIRDGDRTIEGILLGIDQTGALRIETGSGKITTVVAGDLTRGPRRLVADDSLQISEDLA